MRNPQTLSERLTLVRNQHGMTQWQMAQVLGVSQGAVTKYEQGQEVPLPVLDLFCKAFGVRWYWLVKGLGVREQPPSMRCGADSSPARHLRSPLRFRPCHPRPQQGRNSYSTQLRLTGSARWRYSSAQKKGDLKFLSIVRCRGAQWLQCVLCAAQNNACHLTKQGGDRSTRAILALVAATWTLCGCSPYLYQKEVGSFSSSVIAVSNGVTQGLDNLDQDQAAADLAQVIGKRVGVNLSPGCGIEDPSKPCRLMVARQKDPEPSAADKFDPYKPKILKVLAALQAYAEGLAAVTNAQDRKDYDAAASQLASNVAGLGTALAAASPQAAAAGPALSAIVTLTTWTIVKGLDAARYDTLRSAINAVGTPSIDFEGRKASPIQVANVLAITPALAAVRSARLSLIYGQLQARTDRINSDLSATDAAHVSLDRYDTPLTDLVSVVAILNTIKGVDPAAVGESLVKAHNDLQQVVNNKSRQFQSLTSSIGDFADKAAAVEKAFAKKPTSTTPAAK